MEKAERTTNIFEQTTIFKDGLNDIIKEALYDEVYLKDTLSHSITLSFFSNTFKSKYAIREFFSTFLKFFYFTFFKELVALIRNKEEDLSVVSGKIIIEALGTDARTKSFWQPVHEKFKAESVLLTGSKNTHLIIQSEFTNSVFLESIVNRKYVSSTIWLIQFYLNNFFRLKRLFQKYDIGFSGVIHLFSIIAVQVNRIEKAKRIALLKPSSYISIYDRGELGSIVTSVFKKYHIPTFTFVHGAVGYNGMNHFTPVLSDYVFTWGKYTSDLFIKFGTPKTKILEVGCNRMNTNSPVSDTAEKELKIKLSFTENDKIILLGFTAIITQEWIENIVKLTKRVKDFKFIIRPHPSIPKIEIEKIAMILNKEVCVMYCDEYSLSETFAITDYLITDFSTIAFDAVFYKIPVIFLDNTGNAKKNGLAYDLCEAEVALFANEVEDVEKVLGLLNDSTYLNQLVLKQNEFIQKYINSSGEDATQNMVEAIKTVLHKTPIDQRSFAYEFINIILL